LANQDTQALMAKIRHLGRIPKRLANKDDQEARDEDNLARQLQRAWEANIFTGAEEAELDELIERASERHTELKEAATREHAQEILCQIRQLGRIPKDLHTTEDHASKEEEQLAPKLCRARKIHIFTDSEEAELISIGETELKTLIWNAYSADGETMVDLYTAACDIIRKGVKLQSSYDAQLLEELEWRVARERQAHDIEQKALGREELKSIKKTIRAIQSNETKCVCHDFFNWRFLWRADPFLARRLRDTGHHLPYCLLAKVMPTLARQTGKEPHKVKPTTTLESDKLKVVARDPDRSGYILVTSCLDQVQSRDFDPSNGIKVDILREYGSTFPCDDGCPELRGQAGEYSDSGSEHGASEPTREANKNRFTDPS
jgi:hypothetical protein